MKKMLGILMVLAIFMNGITVQAYESETGVMSANVTEAEFEECVKITALDWAAMIYPDVDLTVGNMDYILNESSEPEYAVSFFSQSTPYGYAVIAFDDGDAFVKEGQILQGTKGLREKIIDMMDDTVISSKNLQISNVLIEIAPMQYAVVTKEAGSKVDRVYDSCSNQHNPEDISMIATLSDEMLFGTSQYNSSKSIFITGDNWIPSKYNVKSELTLKKYTDRSFMICIENAEQRLKKYACGVQTLLQIAYMENLCNSDWNVIKNVYNTLWSYTNTKETAESKNDTSTDVIYGETYISDAAKGFVRFAKEGGYKNTEVKNIETDPSVAWLKNKLEYNRPILMSYGINVKGKREGHFISILGYRRATKVASGNTYDYLMVYDSWRGAPVYLNYSTVDMTDCYATYFWVK